MGSRAEKNCSTFFEDDMVRNPPDSRLVEMDICILQSGISKVKRPDVDIIYAQFSIMSICDSSS